MIKNFHDNNLPNSSGKTSIATSICVQAQKAYPDKAVAYIDIEQAFSPKYAQCFGLDLSEDKFLFAQPNCLNPLEYVLTPNGYYQLKDITIGTNLATSLDNNLRTGIVSNVMHSIKNSYEVKTSTFDFISSADHKVKTFNGWKTVGQLTLQDKIESVYKHNLFPVENQTSLNPELSFLLGSFFGDGSYKNKCTFTNIDKPYIDKIIEIIQKYFPETVIKQESKKCLTFTKGYFDSHSICTLHKFLETYLGRVSHKNKIIPPVIFKSGIANIQAFLAGLFMADGMVGSDYVSYSCYIKKAMLDVSSLLSFLGIPFTVSEKTKHMETGLKTYYVLDIRTKEGVQYFKHNIGLISYKKINLDLIDITKKKSFVRFPKDFWNVVFKEIRLKGFKLFEYYNHLYGVNYDKHRFNTKRGISNEYLMFLNSKLNSPILQAYLDSDVRYCNILQIKDLQKSIDMIDITVPKTHNFILNNCVVHNSAEEACEIAEHLAASGACSVIIYDSIGGSLTQAQLEKGVDEATMGSLAKIMSIGSNKIKNACAATGTVCIFLNQVYDNIGSYGGGEKTKGGNSVPFFTSIRLRVARRELIADPLTKEIIGQDIAIKFIKNKVGTPYKELTTKLIFGKGFDFISELVDLCVSQELINKGGAWYAFESYKLQGKSRVVEVFENDPELLEKYKKLSTDKLLNKNTNVVDEVLKEELVDEDGYS